MLVIIKGAGDIATGIATRLKRSNFDVVMTDLEKPTSIRNTVCFSSAIINGDMTVDNVKAEYAQNIEKVLEILKRKNVAVVADPKAEIIKELKPDVVVDAILAKKNTGTKIEDANIVIGIGPGFTAKVDCTVCIETMRGHTLGSVIYDGSPIENTGIPGLIGGKTGERIIKASKDGIFHPVNKIGDMVNEGGTVAYVDDLEVKCFVSGVVRGMLPEGTKVHKGMKSGDVDPRGKIEYCYSCSDKALAVAGGVLEAILHFKD